MSSRSRSPSLSLSKDEKKFLKNYKLSSGFVNEMDGKMIINEVLSLQGLPFKIEDCKVEGVSYNHWKNYGDTLVVRIAMNDVETAIELASAMKKLKADEINTKICHKRRYMRFWWD
jgi:hypothetical protein